MLLLRQRRAQLEAQRVRLLAQQHLLETDVQNLRSNRSHLERLIRRELGYARPNELVYRFPADPKP